MTIKHLVISGGGPTGLKAIGALQHLEQNGVWNINDIVSIYANNDHAVKQLGWHCKYDLEDMMRTAWEWEQSLAN